ncbi:hypothetical protein Thimo_0801 [Thioflavicoccus mobilis 8321]|uniref:TIR domain-containing protein n=1 Tax=Thioflavicoccus mobilis 8321 TaxID=765912 RepID=L0GW85_9GAMM|nr:hypothetical protein Thimo_0801 [Thioflavicoccus mobilis 8321]
MTHIFVSHATRDRKLLVSLERALQSQSKGELTIWHSDNLTVGLDWTREIQRRIVIADAYVLLVTESYSQSLDSAYEMGMISQAHQNRHVPAIPVWQHPATPELSPLRNLLGVSLPQTNSRDFEEALQRAADQILKAVDQSISSRKNGVRSCLLPSPG